MEKWAPGGEALLGGEESEQGLLPTGGRQTKTELALALHRQPPCSEGSTFLAVGFPPE